MDITEAFHKDFKNIEAFERIIGVPLPADLALLLKHQILEPHSADTYITRGTAYLKNGESDLAIADFSKAIELDIGNVTAYQNRGIAYYNKSRFYRAVDDFSKVITLTPDQPFAYLGRERGLPQPTGF